MSRHTDVSMHDDAALSTIAVDGVDGPVLSSLRTAGRAGAAGRERGMRFAQASGSSRWAKGSGPRAGPSPGSRTRPRDADTALMASEHLCAGTPRGEGLVVDG